MLSGVRTNPKVTPTDTGLGVRRAKAREQKWQPIAEAAILILGSPRSGTTWLAKIFDSHPDTLYRHEPDELTRPTVGLQPLQQVSEWLWQRGLRASAKRPNFRKSWRPAPLENARKGLAAMLAVSQRMPALSRAAAPVFLPDLVAPGRWKSVRGLVKLVNWDGTSAAKTMPNARCVFILRHPCGQVASVLAGLAKNHPAGGFDHYEAPENIASAMAWAGHEGVDAASFKTLSDAAKYAWSWRAFNEPAVWSLRERSNAQVILYEDLCREPEAISKELFAFAGLSWTTQTVAFLGTSTRHQGPSAYFDVFRSTDQVVDRWRETMSPDDEDAVRAVVAASPLARCWPDLLALA